MQKINYQEARTIIKANPQTKVLVKTGMKECFLTGLENEYCITSLTMNKLVKDGTLTYLVNLFYD